jgi:hypothetical protein
MCGPISGRWLELRSLQDDHKTKCNQHCGFPPSRQKKARGWGTGVSRPVRPEVFTLVR